MPAVIAGCALAVAGALIPAPFGPMVWGVGLATVGAGFGWERAKRAK